MSQVIENESGGEAPTDGNTAATRLEAVYRKVLARSEGARARYPVPEGDREASRDNLLAYLAFREHDLPDLQLELSEQGLSSLGRIESGVVVGLERVLRHLAVRPAPHALRPLADARAVLAERSRELLGRPREGRATRIMVTLDSASIRQGELIEQLLAGGMDIARINCAHDGPAEWELLIGAIRRAEERLKHRGRAVGRRCHILMDLAGPKLRTGTLVLEKAPLKLRVRKDERGSRVRLLEGYLDRTAACTDEGGGSEAAAGFTLAVSGPDFSHLKPGDHLRLVDLRERSCALRILARESRDRLRVGLERTAYIEDGTPIRGPKQRGWSVRGLAPQPASVTVQAGDTLRIYRDPLRPGHAASGETPAGISCTLPQVLERLVPGHRVFIDDGKLAALVAHLHPEWVDLEITSPQPVHVKSEKGINFPDTHLDLPALMPEDRESLAFVARHADAVGLSFAHQVQDLRDLAGELEVLDRSELGIVVKIESVEAIHNLGSLLLAGLSLPRFGVMIARGDLAVEVGFENLALVQEDILCLCEAAHVPVIWATQVLETLAKSGLPARAEITDAAMGQRAECVMLNKGPHIVEAVETLAELVSAEERHRIKKRQVFREFTAQHGVF